MPENIRLSYSRPQSLPLRKVPPNEPATDTATGSATRSCLRVLDHLALAREAYRAACEDEKDPGTVALFSSLFGLHLMQGRQLSLALAEREVFSDPPAAFLARSERDAAALPRGRKTTGITELTACEHDLCRAYHSAVLACASDIPLLAIVQMQLGELQERLGDFAPPPVLHAVRGTPNLPDEQTIVRPDFRHHAGAS